MSKETENKDFVKVTLKIPKGLIEMFQAAKDLAKATITLEDWLCDRIGDNVEDILNELNGGLEPFLGSKVDLVSYGLDELLKVKG